jgi:predicted DNA binding CopG/RHH family protein
MEDKKITVPDEEFYTKEELEYFKTLEEGLENGTTKFLVGKELEREKEIAKIAAKNTIERLTKKKTYSLKLIENDVETIKGMALREGLPYQTFIASLLHKIATKQIVV